MNYNEHKYTIRSSDPLFIFYIVSILAVATTVHTHYNDQQTSRNEYCIIAASLVSLILGFIVEAWPRGSTQVQLKSGAQAFEKANFFSRRTFHFFQPIVSLAAKQRILQPSDIVNQLPERHSTKVGYARLSTYWNKAVKRYQAKVRAEHDLDADGKIKSIKKPPLMTTIFAAHWKSFLPIFAMGIAITMAEYISPALLGVLLDYIGAPEEGEETSHSLLSWKEEKPLAYGLAIALSIFATKAIIPMMYTYFLQSIYLLGTEIKAALVAMIYRKALRLSPDARRKSSTGAITNHMSVDANLWQDGVDILTNWITLPFDFTICLYMCKYRF